MPQKHTYSFCFCFRRKFNFKVAEVPTDIKTTFDRYSDNGIMDIDQLRKFLIEYQGENTATKEEAQAIIDSFKHLHLFHRKGLDLETFFVYLFGDVNCPLSHKVHHDMTAPLAEYFIYTGHNSYLTGNQLIGQCSENPITNALLRGVRGIELDMWPNSKHDDVEIRHGRALTTPVALNKCLWSIKENAFKASPYPVVVTLEDHLTTELQKIVAKEFTEIFKDMLYRPKPECFEILPSPDSLKGKIIISTKPPKQDSSQKVESSSKENLWGSEISDDIKSIGKNDVTKDMDDVGNVSQHSAEPEYKHLIAIHSGKPKGGIKEALRVDPHKVRRISLNEEKLKKAMISHGPNIVRFTQRNMLRVYPKGMRVDSSNYNPLVGWTLGAQMVAFNMQGYGRYLWLMHGMFRGNGGCGYMKKPDILTRGGSNNHVFNRSISEPVKKTLKVRVYMGDGWHLDFDKTYFDKYSPPDFYTRIGIAGVPADSMMRHTKKIQDDWSPIWNEEFQFPLVVPELALLRIEVHEYDMSGKDDFGGQTCLPVSELKMGIRAVPLFNHEGEPLPSVKLLMRFEFL